MARKPGEPTSERRCGGEGPPAFVACACSAPRSFARPLTTPSIAVNAQAIVRERAMTAAAAFFITAEQALFREGARIALHLTQERRSKSTGKKILALARSRLLSSGSAGSVASLSAREGRVAGLRRSASHARRRRSESRQGPPPTRSNAVDVRRFSCQSETGLGNYAMTAWVFTAKPR